MTQALDTYRLKRAHGQRIRHDMAGVVLFDPVNIRRATSTRNMQLITPNRAEGLSAYPFELKFLQPIRGRTSAT